MANYIYHRIICYVVTIVLHLWNIMYMAASLDRVKDEPELKTFSRLQPRYFTCWNIAVQIIYASVSICCEVLLWMNSNNTKYQLNKHLRRLRDVLFAGILWPSTMMVFSIFWSIYAIDRELIFPRFADKALTSLSNHIIHTLILPIALWEVTFRPRAPPRSHKRNIAHLVFHLLLYFSVLTYTYVEHGIWIYPILTNIYGTLYFPLTVICILLISLAYYYLQWPLGRYVWGNESTMKKYS